MSDSPDKYFYHNLKSFSDFKDITNDKHFTVVPEDWLIYITDIVKSTVAIKKGQYKDVNTIGAASIVSAHNAMGNLEFPYVFGGDGASFLIPPEYKDNIEKELKALKEISKRGFGLDLRIAVVKVSEVINDGASIELAKYKIIGKKAVAIIKGGGMSLAENKIKNDLDKYEIKGRIKHMVDLKSLSCRWNAIPAKRGKNLSLLVLARRTNQKIIFNNILKMLEKLYDGKLDDANPVNFNKMTYRSFFESFKSEKKLHTSVWSIDFFKRILGIFTAVALFKLGLSKKVKSAGDYAQSMSLHSDYRKFDDMLRMTIDCSPKQIDTVQKHLESLYQSGDIFYGTHTSDKSIMTCFVKGLGPGDHIHFIDGGGGGYAMASKQLKAQVNTVHS